MRFKGYNAQKGCFLGSSNFPAILFGSCICLFCFLRRIFLFFLQLQYSRAASSYVEPKAFPRKAASRLPAEISRRRQPSPISTSLSGAEETPAEEVELDRSVSEIVPTRLDLADSDDK